MAAEVRRLEGVEDLTEALAALPAELVSRRGGVVLAALRKGAQVVRRQIITNARGVIGRPGKDGRPSQSAGTLVKSFRTSRMTKVGRGVLQGLMPGVDGEQVAVWPRGKKGQYKARRTTAQTPQVANWLERGTDSEQIRARRLKGGPAARPKRRKTKPARRKMAARPFIGPAFASTREQALSVVVRELQAGLQKAIQKVRR